MVGSESTGSRQPGPSAHLLFNKIKVTHIPIIKELRKELDYGHAGSQRDIVFYNTLRSYTLSFISSDGIPGVEFIRWKFRPHQIGLLEMVSQFLDKDGKGSHFWPDDVEAPNHGKLQYSKEHRRIRRLLTQLFFRMNQQQRWKRSPHPANNPQQPERTSSTYHIRDNPNWSAVNSQRESTAERQEQSAVNGHERGRNAEDAINLDSYWFDGDLLTETKPDKSDWDNATTATPEPPYTSQGFEVSSRGHFDHDDQRLHVEIRTRGDNTQAAPVAPMIDPFDGPYSPGPDVPPAVAQPLNTNKRPAPHGRDEGVPLAKRPQCHPSDRTGKTTNDPLPSTVSSRSPSSRQRKHPNKDGYLFGTEYEEVLQSPPSSAATSAVSTPDPEDDWPLANRETKPNPPPTNISQKPAQTTPATVQDASQGTIVETEPIPPVLSIPENLSRTTPATVDDSLQGSNTETEPVLPPTAPPKEPVPSTPVTTENASQNVKPRDGERQPSSVPPIVSPIVPPRASDHDVDPKLTPNPQPEPEEEQSKKKRQILPKVNLIFMVKSQKANKGWVPKGSFQQKSLGQLVDELPLETPFDGLRLVLQEIPGEKFEFEVLLGDEEVFNSIKVIFREKISEVRRGHAGSAKTVTFVMSISPLKDGEDGDGREYEGDEDNEDDFVF